MNRKRPWRRAILVLVVLVLIAAAARMAIRFADAQVSYSDESYDIELIEPAAPPPETATVGN